jgi:hypothetical protein
MFQNLQLAVTVHQRPARFCLAVSEARETKYREWQAPTDERTMFPKCDHGDQISNEGRFEK